MVVEVLFLDIDGVLNSWQSAYWALRKSKGRLSSQLCPIAVSNLDELMVKNPALKIVISSTWRSLYPLQELKEILKDQGFENPHRIIGYTPEFPFKDRYFEIKAWIDQNPTVQKYLILDDKPVLNANHRDYSVAQACTLLIDGTVGFNWRNLYEANDYFGGEQLGVCLM